MVVDMFTMSIETVETTTAMGDITSALNMVVNNRIENGTSVSCRTAIYRTNIITHHLANRVYLR